MPRRTITLRPSARHLANRAVQRVPLRRWQECREVRARRCWSGPAGTLEATHTVRVQARRSGGMRGPAIRRKRRAMSMPLPPRRCRPVPPPAAWARSSFPAEYPRPNQAAPTLHRTPRAWDWVQSAAPRTASCLRPAPGSCERDSLGRRTLAWSSSPPTLMRRSSLSLSNSNNLHIWIKFSSCPHRPVTANYFYSPKRQTRLQVARIPCRDG